MQVSLLKQLFKRFVVLGLFVGAIIWYINSQKFDDVDKGKYIDPNANLAQLYINAQDCKNISPINNKQAVLCLKVFKTLKDNVPESYPLYKDISEASLLSINRIDIELKFNSPDFLKDKDSVLQARYGQLLLRNQEAERWTYIENKRAEVGDPTLVIQEPKEESSLLFGSLLIVVFVIAYVLSLSFKGKTKKFKYMQLLQKFGLDYSANLILKDIQQVEKRKYYAGLSLKKREVLNQDEYNDKKITAEDREILMYIYKNMWSIELAYMFYSELKLIKNKREERLQKIKINKIITSFSNKILEIKEKLKQ